MKKTMKKAQNANLDKTAGAAKVTGLCTIPPGVWAAMTKGVPKAKEAFVAAAFPKVVAAVAANVGWTRRAGEVLGKELAVSAATYVLAGYVNGEYPWPVDEKGWTTVAEWKAKLLAQDLGNRVAVRRTESLDAVSEGDEGETLESGSLNKASWDAWREDERQKERQALIEAVRYAIPRVAFKMSGKNVLRNYKIVRAVYQDDYSIPEVAARFQIQPNAVYQCLFRFRDAFEAEGRRYMEEYLAA